MDKSRRKILSSLLTAGIAGGAIANGLKLNAKETADGFIFQDEKFYNLKKDNINSIPILPAGLKQASKIAIVAPASHASSWELRSMMKTMNNLGIEVEIGDTIKNYSVNTKYFSAPDEVRAKELMDYIERDDINAIMTCRGGYGVLRILDMLNFKTICENPKIIIGFSDITALLNAVYQKCNIVTYHGPVGISSFNSITLKSFEDILLHKDDFKEITYTDSRINTINNGIATGRLIGGNLTMLASTLGSPYEIETESKILFIEEVSEDPYKIDRMLTQLHLSKKLQDCAGIMFGHYPTLDKKYYFYPNLSYTAREVIESRLKQLNIPAVIGIPIGHIEDKWTMPIGVLAELDADKKEIKILEQTVS
ncbi:LD-carboxypeptidase [Bacteroidota bacterium]